jgi:hypothetical protein
MTIEALATNRYKEVARSHGTRINGNAPDRGRAVTRNYASTTGGGHIGCG